MVLRARKGLITDGLFSMSRNPNYLGEMFIYAAFAGKISSSSTCSFYLLSSPQRLPGITRRGGGPGPSSSWSGQCSSTPRGWPRTDTRSGPGPDIPHTQLQGCHEDCKNHHLYMIILWPFGSGDGLRMEWETVIIMYVICIFFTIYIFLVIFASIVQ